MNQEARKRQEPTPARSSGGGAARAFGWVLGLAVILGTAAMVLISLDGTPIRTKTEAYKPPRVCPPVVSIPARGLGQPVDDVFNVRPGMNARDVEETIKCVSEDFVGKAAQFANEAEESGQATRPVAIYKRGDETVTVAMFGPFGQERAAGIWRERFYDAKAGPTVASVEQEVLAHYGPAHDARDTPNGGRVLSWTFAPDGKPLRKRPADGDIPGMVSFMASGWKVAGCIKNARPDPAVMPDWNADCGLTLRVEIDPNLGDKLHTARWRLVLLDQGLLARLAAPYKAPAPVPAPSTP